MKGAKKKTNDFVNKVMERKEGKKEKFRKRLDEEEGKKGEGVKKKKEKKERKRCACV